MSATAASSCLSLSPRHSPRMAQITVTHITDPLPDAAWRDLLGRLVLTTNLNAPANSVAPPRDIIRINAQIRDDPMPPTATQAVVNQTDKPATDQNEDPDAPMPPNPSVRSYFLVGAAQAWNVMIEHGKAAAQIMDWFDQSDQTAAHLVVAVQRINTTVHAIETVPVTYAGGRTVTYTRNRRIHVAALCPTGTPYEQRLASIFQRNPLSTFLGTAAVSTVAVPVAVGGALHAVGFRAAGVGIKTWAASIQSTIGNVAAGSAFAVCQSVGAAGLAAGTVTDSALVIAWLTALANAPREGLIVRIEVLDHTAVLYAPRATIGAWFWR